MRILGRKCLVLGSGGASLSVQYVLRKLGAGEIVVISRTGEDNYTNLDRHRDASILVNTTPVGMYPNTAASPVDLREFPQCEGVLDLIYNPARTALLQQAEALGIPCLGGLYMLAEQARCAAQIFTGEVIPAIRTKEAYHALSRRKENRILIGMPGCGKSTVGQALAAQAAGADYLGVGALFGTPTKPDATLVSLDELRAVCQAVDVPVVAIGGLNERTVPALAGTGVDGAAVVSALFAAADPQAAARTLAARVRAVLE